MYCYRPWHHRAPGEGATTVTNRYERLRMQRRIRLVLEERRAAFAGRDSEPAVDPEATMEIPPPQRAVGRVTVRY
ncbi:hypothetical protein MB27_40930 [Actinoplanes utahensis]|uniref:Uncharacterized protein n=1 Tax=Actinoplanes utahensis TaxID=1869 RepID=A0A0A6UB92_ACTUT|nr:hypothetical protein MB27_40930 [Actinoplanes utahensis]